MTEILSTLKAKNLVESAPSQPVDNLSSKLLSRDNIIDNLDSQLSDAKELALKAQERLEEALSKECEREEDHLKIKELEKRLESIAYES